MITTQQHQSAKIEMRKTFDCIPGSRMIPLISLLGTCLMIYNSYMCFTEGEKVAGIVSFLCATFCFVFFIWCWDRTMWKVHIHEKSVVCKAPFEKDIVMEYENCTIGVDYHLVANGKCWWIYFCQGKPPVFDPKKNYKRMNSLKCKQGFIRIAYQEEIYYALLGVLPKKQKTALITAVRCARLDKT